MTTSRAETRRRATYGRVYELVIDGFGVMSVATHASMVGYVYLSGPFFCTILEQSNKIIKTKCDGHNVSLFSTKTQYEWDKLCDLMVKAQFPF